MTVEICSGFVTVLQKIAFLLFSGKELVEKLTPVPFLFSAYVALVFKQTFLVRSLL